MKKFPEPIYVTNPVLPSLDALQKELVQIWKSKWLTNMGEKHKLLQERLKKELKVPNVSLFNNGTIALLTAIKALNLPLHSEVITTPFTFPGTPHCISWNNLKPVFCDIEPKTMTIDAIAMESSITPNTSAILAVHIYGFPCDVYTIDAVAKKHGIKVIYDGAHVFSTDIDGKGIGTFGDITMFSFHATKLFNTAEGGCLTYKDNALADKIYNLRNFGIRDEESVVDIGINGKMTEIQASLGLLNLELYKDEIEKRKIVKKRYCDNLSSIKGIRMPVHPDNATDSCQYMLIVIEDEYSVSRDTLCTILREHNVFARKYFHPLCSDYEPYKSLHSSHPDNLPVANDIQNRVLCLPFY
ncbi:MAG: DegT/DnrJ/EryC1/StrS family aminotransferase, partial [Elusimicrobia bacterium]|nr:DegT/DnrJ/EryC1/StrS family aminotransferase [Elusimicrobiota bacterium]